MMDKIIKVCDGATCRKNLSHYTFERAAASLGVDNLKGGTSSDKKILLKKCGCLGNCSKGPIVETQELGNTKRYEKVSPVEMGNIIKKIK